MDDGGTRNVNYKLINTTIVVNGVNAMSVCIENSLQSKLRWIISVGVGFEIQDYWQNSITRYIYFFYLQKIIQNHV